MGAQEKQDASAHQEVHQVLGGFSASVVVLISSAFAVILAALATHQMKKAWPWSCNRMTSLTENCCLFMRWRWPDSFTLEAVLFVCISLNTDPAGGASARHASL